MKSLVTTAPEDLLAKEIMAVPEIQPELLFQPDADLIKTRFRRLAMLWHPDRHPGNREAGDVLERLTTLKKQADAKLANGKWETPNEVQFADIGTGHVHKIKYLKKHEFELGELYVSKGLVTYAVKKDYADLFDNAMQTIGALPYANDDMRKECQRYLPTIVATVDAADRKVMVIKKNPSQILLADLREHLGGKIDPKQAAWMLSTMHNVACYLNYAGLAHNGIALDTYFVDPENHSGSLLGGWWYAAKAHQPLKGLPPQTVAIVPPDVLNTGVADTRVDLMLIRSVGRALLDDPHGMRLPRDKDVPAAMADWLTLPPTEDASTDYKKWDRQVLPDAFGPRRFVPSTVRFNDVYQS